MSKPSTRGMLMSRSSRLPWDDLQVGDSFFVRDATTDDLNNIRVAASRRKMRIRTHWANEHEGYGLRVTRVV